MMYLGLQLFVPESCSKAKFGQLIGQWIDEGGVLLSILMVIVIRLRIQI